VGPRVGLDAVNRTRAIQPVVIPTELPRLQGEGKQYKAYLISVTIPASRSATVLHEQDSGGRVLAMQSIHVIRTECQCLMV
jgi:hypothetical protein